MTLGLWYRHHGLHKLIREISVKCDLEEVYFGDNDINENLLISLIPNDFLPTKPNNILLSYDENGHGTGQYGLNIFRNWSKYFDCYVLSISK